MLFPHKTPIQRHPNNPILTAADMPGACRAVYNSGITMFNGEYLMVCRYESTDKKQCFWLARSQDGVKFTPDPAPLDIVIPQEFAEEYAVATEGMYYDPRVTYLPEDDTYYVFYACHSGYGARIGMAKTQDFKQLHFFGFGSSTENRNAVLFPEKINGEYVRLERPQQVDGPGRGHLWISYSPDFIHWGRHKMIATGTSSWEWKKIGAGAPPIKTDRGWLEIYHAVYGIVTIEVYQLGVMFHDLKNPSKIIRRTPAPLLCPEEDYERVGEAPNVVFTAGAILEDDGEVKIYYGGADTVQCLATAKLDDLWDACEPV